MSLKLLNLTKIVPFESSFDSAKDTPDAVRFMIAAIPTGAFNHIVDSNTRTIREDGEFHQNTKTLSMTMDMIRFGLKDIENIQNIDIGDEPLTKLPTEKIKVGSKYMEVVSQEFIDMLPVELMAELADAIANLNTVTEDERKN
jgi:hypothetical protein